MRYFRDFQCNISRDGHDDHGGHGGHSEGSAGEHRGRGVHSPRGGRIFSHGSLRFVLLQLISDKPSHGYELIKLIEDRVGGSYSPSPGTVYPTLTLLEEQDYLQVEEADAGGRKRYCITDAGRAFLAENRVTVDAMLARMQGGVDGAGPRGGRPHQVMRAIENLKLAMRMRLSRDALTSEQANAFAAVLDHAAQQLEQI
ncbi:PadR family transcriptional regulator [Glaciimonas sp. CA11.2]|uniref:PadR family transcriptional regulator n=1 Tax=unclassified Glaciimonas TaxID=2644401 RepID=UPI002AB50BAB|nr:MULTISPECIES: PadR family transcriptional regulator [unclassified Glaciimonas]MDY7548601.1 PadR family transcriptional regulator [Glaciimonas sp. CA11.2]MEB0013988.1 PadR family transcriptional regulator [Glaciimonas sp. Cout2]MEB0084082.1 PadR family transcriptional regulator [Glaciimonas sp. Gout2]MEB0164516.1 PadR family transcriptional regulator [Glaciimonas sp. CA11.2]